MTQKHVANAGLLESGVSVVVPAYNEEQGLAPTMHALLDALADAPFPYEVIVVDDGSTDGTAAVARGLEGIRFYQNPQNLGYGATLKHGIRKARYDTVVITDADGTYPNERIPGLVAMLTDDVDMVVGWRKGVQAKIPLTRRPAKWAIQKFAESLAGYAIPDLNSGLRVFRTATARDHEAILPAGFSFTTTITLLVASGGGRILYEPIDYHHRAGSSKFRPIRDTWRMISLIVRSVLLFDPLRVFVPAALALMAAGVAIFLYGKLVLGLVLDGSATVLIVTGVQFLFLGLLADLVNRRAR